MQIEMIDVGSLLKDPANVRTHNQKNIDAIKGSLKRFGQQKPIVIDKDGIVVAGNGTLIAAVQLGWDKIACVRSDLLGTDKTAYAIADNRTAELAAWDMPALQQQLISLKDMDFNLGEIGFDNDDLDKMLPEIVPPHEGDEDEIPEQVETICQPGDLWILGDHRLLCGDSTNSDHVKRLIDELKPILMVTDPPYGVSYDAEWRKEALGDKFMGKVRTGKVSNDDKADWTPVWALADSVKIAYVWHASVFSDVVMNSLKDADYEVRQQIIWNKTVAAVSRSAYHWKHEPCWYAVKKGSDANWCGDRKQITVWDAASPLHIMSGSKEEKTPHPTQKPSLIYEIPIANHTNKKDGLYDPFSGSGTAFIACEKTGRRCFGMEIDPHYCDIIIARWEKYTGKQAKLTPINTEPVEV